LRRLARGVTLDFAELSDPGLDATKQVNEDSSGAAITPLGHVAVVCDGMGGHAGGREASRVAVDTILDSLGRADSEEAPEQAVTDAIRVAGRAVHALGGTAPRDLRPGSTCVLALISEKGLMVAHVGDSRAYLLRGESVIRLTRDHSLVQQMLDAGVLAPEDAAGHPEANRITRALGMTAQVEPEASPEWLPLRPGDVVLLSSDGLTDLIEDRELGMLNRQHSPAGLEVVCRELVELANLRGGHDNITVQLVRVVEVPGGHGTIVLGRSGHAAPTAPGDAAVSPRLKTLPDVAIHALPTLLDEPTLPIQERATIPGPPPAALGPAPQIPELLPPARPSRRMGRLWVIGLGMLALAGLAVWWWLGQSTDEESIPAPEPKASRTHTAPSPPASEPCEVPGQGVPTTPAQSGAPSGPGR
jgi:PPM family protein phosphatase